MPPGSTSTSAAAMVFAALKFDESAIRSEPERVF
jgi:hypothetical protein